MRIRSRVRSRTARAPWLVRFALTPTALAVSAMLGCVPEPQAQDQSPGDDGTTVAAAIAPACSNFPAVPAFTDFPQINSLITQDPAIEARRRRHLHRHHELALRQLLAERGALDERRW